MCKPCEAKRVAAWKQRKVDEGTWAEYVKNKKPKNTNKIRRYQREYKAAKRREQGVPARKSAKETRVVVPVEPISVLLHLLEESYTREEISIRSGVEERRLYDIANLAVPNTSIDNVDKLLMGFDRESDLNELYPLEEKEELVAGYYYLDPEGVLKTPEEQVE